MVKRTGYNIEKHDPSSDQKLLVISHGVVIMTLIAIKENIPFEESHLRISVPNATPLFMMKACG